MENYDKVESILIIRDSESDAHGSESSVQSSLRATGLEIPSGLGVWAGGTPKVAYLLLPTLDATYSEGALEDLCFGIIKDIKKNEIEADIQTFLSEMEKKFAFRHPRIFKNKLHTYFSVRDEFVSMKIGEATKANAFDLSSDKLKFFRNLLLQLY